VRVLRVCILTETYYPVVGGGETQVQSLAEGLVARGHSVIILTRRSDRALEKYDRVKSVRVYRLAPGGAGQLKKWGLVFSSLPLLVSLYKEYDVIFVSGFRVVGATSVIASKLLRKRCILKADSRGEMSGAFFADGLENLGLSPSWLPYRALLNLRNFVLRRADAFSAISEEIRAEFISNRIRPSKIHKIPNSVDTSRYFPVKREEKSLLRKKLGLPESATIVIYTGRLVSYKGLPLLLEVWKKIRVEHRNAKLLILGTGGMDIHNCEKELHAYAKSNGLEDSVRFAGSVRNVADYLQASDIFAFPTENDAFPSSILEAMACGLALVTTPVGAIGSVIRDNENGLLTHPGNGQQLFEALDKLIRNKPLAVRLGQAAVKSVHDRYSTEAVTGKYLAMFERLQSQA
jgi:glycosyltransferase involved in cell wall biosynthesis